MTRPFNLTILRAWVWERRDAARGDFLARPATADAALKAFGKFKRYVRWQDWALSRIPMLCTVGSYVGLVYGNTTTKFFTDFLVFTFLFATANSAFGFLVNDLGDRELDRHHGKRNTFVELGTKKALRLLSVVIAVMLLSSLRFLDRPAFALLWALWWLAAIAYSLPPLRLKERGAAGIVISSVAQWTLPVLIAFAALEAGTPWELWMFVLATTISGATLELAHQRHDLPNDQGTRTSTFAVNRGKRRIDRLYASALWLDRIAVGAVLAVIVWRTHSLALNNYLFTAVPVILLIFTYIAALSNLSLRFIKGEEMDPYYGPRTAADRIVHDVLPNLLIPAYLLTQLMLESPVWSAALVAFLIWRLLLPRLN